MGANGINRIGMLFSGGPAPAANAVISAAALSFLNAGIEVMGFLDGYEDLEEYSRETPLIENEHYLCLNVDDVSGIRNEKAIILRTSRANPGKSIKGPEDLKDREKTAKLRAVYQALEDYGIDGLISIGGDDTLKTANFLYLLQHADQSLKPIRIIHLPKTIDNDYYGIDWTFGFTSAANFAATEIRNLSADAKSTKAWYVLEIMGRKAGWLTYAAGIAGEATRIFSVEDVDMVFDAKKVAAEMVDLVVERGADGREYGIICVAEGLADHLPEDQKPQQVDEHGNTVLGAAQIGRLLADEICTQYQKRSGHKIVVRHKQIGYETRCTEPVAFDILLGSQLGVGAYRAMTEEGLSGHMVSVEDQLQLKYVPFDQLIDPRSLLTMVRYIDRDSDFYKLARALEYQRIHEDVHC